MDNEKYKTLLEEILGGRISFGAVNIKTGEVFKGGDLSGDEVASFDEIIEHIMNQQQPNLSPENVNTIAERTSAFLDWLLETFTTDGEPSQFLAHILTSATLSSKLRDKSNAELNTLDIKALDVAHIVIDTMLFMHASMNGYELHYIENRRLYEASLETVMTMIVKAAHASKDAQEQAKENGETFNRAAWVKDYFANRGDES